MAILSCHVSIKLPPKISDGQAKTFHLLIWTEWIWKVPDTSARVLVCLTASRATRALKAAECRFFVSVMTLLGMEQ